MGAAGFNQALDELLETLADEKPRIIALQPISQKEDATRLCIETCIAAHVHFRRDRDPGVVAAAHFMGAAGFNLAAETMLLKQMQALQRADEIKHPVGRVRDIEALDELLETLADEKPRIMTQVLWLQRTSWVPLVSIWQLKPCCSSRSVNGVRSDEIKHPVGRVRDIEALDELLETLADEKPRIIALQPISQKVWLQRTSWVPLVSIWQLKPCCSSRSVNGVRS
jgi:uncharacterized ParB-like nuclease family protein